jgi:peptidoglycan hydrolase CwlO-like protein
MNDTANETSDSRSGSFLPTILLALALSFFFIYQLSSLYDLRTQLKAQKANADQQITAQVMQSAQIQSELEKIVRDLLDLSAKGDKDAKAIVDKYGIKVNAPAAAPAK